MPTSSRACRAAVLAAALLLAGALIVPASAQPFGGPDGGAQEGPSDEPSQHEPNGPYGNPGGNFPYGLPGQAGQVYDDDPQLQLDQSPPTGSAVQAAQDMADMLDGAGGGVSGDDLITVLEGAAANGQALALFQLGTMYENGEGVAKDPVKAFGYFSQIANDHADVAPRSLEADIVAQSFVKVGEYYREGLPDAGIAVDEARSHALMMHAATYFGDAEAQFQVGLLYLQEDGLGVNPLQSARWLSLAARKGHVAAQATLGDMLFNGVEGIQPQPAEGLMWLTIASSRANPGTDDKWIGDAYAAAMASATADQKVTAAAMVKKYGPSFVGG